MADLNILDIGKASYSPTLEFQQTLVERVKNTEDEEAFLVLVEHDPPVITIGRNGTDRNVLASKEMLARMGFETFEINRGGDVTYHGPGQIVAYPIIRLDLHGKDLHKYLRDIEEVIIRVLAEFKITGHRVEGLTGVWAGNEKIAATGITVKKWVTYHGLALNVCPDLSHYQTIVPCGITDKGVTSLSALLGRQISTYEVKPILMKCFGDVFGFSFPSIPVSPRHRVTASLPKWLKKRVPSGGKTASGVSTMLSDMKLKTVCSGAHCPNLPECYARKTATFMILGENCTRNCRFCAVEQKPVNPPDPYEPESVAEASAKLGLRHVVITSVTRDDLPDGGAAHFAATINAVRKKMPNAVIEILTPDFKFNKQAIDTVIDSQPDVFNHNVETAPRLYESVRPEADYNQSLEVLRYIAQSAAKKGIKLHTKSGLMVGLGESNEEVIKVIRDLRDAGCSILTIGQYLAPTDKHLPVVHYVEPPEYELWAAAAKAMGFSSVAAGPFVRSSYQAEEVFLSAK
ncbi:lipoyl synthase [Verrucomicrobiota bacterium]